MPEPICLAVLRLITNHIRGIAACFGACAKETAVRKKVASTKTAGDMDMNSHLANSDLPRTRRFTSSCGLNNQKMTERQSGMLLCQRNVKKELRKRNLNCWTLTAAGSIAFNIRGKSGQNQWKSKKPK